MWGPAPSVVSLSIRKPTRPSLVVLTWYQKDPRNCEIGNDGCRHEALQRVIGVIDRRGEQDRFRGAGGRGGQGGGLGGGLRCRRSGRGRFRRLGGDGLGGGGGGRGGGGLDRSQGEAWRRATPH